MISEVIAALEARGSHAVIGDDLARDIEPLPDESV
jgi:hypothetical protein